MNLQYILSRFARHSMPDSAARFLLRRGWIIRPGMETRFPEQALQRYLQRLGEQQVSVAGKRVLVFGYGGNFALGCGLLRAGAGHVVLSDKFAPPDEENNRKLLPDYADYLIDTPAGIRTRPEYLTLSDDDIVEMADLGSLQPVDLVLSNSVYEHLSDVDQITKALARLTKTAGVQLHFVDLRDHYFKFPFEMLTYSEKTWRNWLNPTSNLNRNRLLDYQKIFERYFNQVDISVLERDLDSYHKVEHRIRSEFLTGNPEIDSVTLIQIFVANPIQ